MEINENPDAPVTRFTSMNVVPEQNNIMEGDFFGFPQLTQAQIDEIPVENLLPGIVVYNTDFNVYMAYFINEEDDLQNRWMNINTSLTYKSTGLEVGSPFALPAGVSTVIENPASGNSDPGVMYIATDLNDQPRIYINGAWQNVAAGGESPIFTDITVTNEAQITNLVVTGPSTFIGNITADVIGAEIITALGITTNELTVNDHLNVFDSAEIQVLQISTGICGDPSPPNLPTLALGTAGHGSGGTPNITLQGGELSGIITMRTGTGLSGNVIFTFTMNNPEWQIYSSNFGAIFTPASGVTTADGNNATISAVVTQLATMSVPHAVITMFSGGNQLNDDTVYAWNYIIIGNSGVPIP